MVVAESLQEISSLFESFSLSGNAEPAADNVFDTVVNYLLNIDDDTNPRVISKILEAVGDLATNKQDREKLGNREGVITKICNLLLHDWNGAEGYVFTLSYAARAIGNLAYDEVENVKKILEFLTAEQFLELTRKEQDADLLCNLAGALSNIISVHPDDSYVQQLLQAGICPLITQLLRHPSTEVATQAARAIANFSDSPESKQLLTEAGALEQLIEVSFSGDTDPKLIDEALAALTTLLSEYTPNVNNFIVKDGIKRAMQKAFSDTLPESVRVKFFDLLAVITDDDNAVKIFETQFIDQLLQNAMPNNESVSIRGCLKLLGHLARNDACMLRIFRGYKLFLRYLDNQNNAIRINALMSLGNVARTEDYCTRIIESNVLPKLVTLLADEDSRVQHLAASAIRNLAIPVQFKITVGNTPDIFPGLVNVITKSNDAVVLFAVVMALKVILGTTDSSLVDKFLAADGLSVILGLFSRVINDDQKRIQYESARMLASLALANTHYRSLIVEAEDGVKALSMLCDSQFTILQHEGLKVLSEIAKKSSWQTKLVEQGAILSIVKCMGVGDSNIRQMAKQLMVYLFGAAQIESVSFDHLLDHTNELVLQTNSNDPK